MENAHILVVEDSEITLFKLKAILLRLGYQVTTQPNPLAAIQWLENQKTAPDLILSDVLMPEMDGYAFTRKLRERPSTAQTPIILLTAQQDVADKVAGLQAGADDYILKTVSSTELELRIKALLSRTQQTGNIFNQAAKTISVFSLRGGVGTTSIAINLAAAFSQLWGIEATLWDMALSSGHCSFILNAKPEKTLASLANWPNDETVDPTIIAEFFLRHEAGIILLPCPAAPVDAELITATTVELVWPFIQRNSSHLIIDAGNHFSEPVIPILEQSDLILLVISPELASVKSAHDALQIFTTFGIDPEKILLVANNTFPDHHLPAQRISSALRKEISATIPYDSAAFLQTINTGRPFVVTSPKLNISQAIFTLVYQISSKEMEMNQNARPSAILNGLKKRIAGVA